MTAVTSARDPAGRDLYRQAALAQIPRLLGAIDRNPFRPTYGCLDRQFWHYRTACFPSEMYQEGVLPLALVYAQEMPENRWHGDARVKELAVAGIRYAARSSHRDGSCDDYYPFERALGAAVFSLQATTRAYQLLRLNDDELVTWFRHRADWIASNDESGRLTNHHALAALGLLRIAEISDDDRYRQAADARIDRVLKWQDREGWFNEYGGADPGYQTVTIDCLAKYLRATGDHRLEEPLRRAVHFARHFLHPDGSYAGEYGSRGTYHFYPHGMELLAGENSDAADLADGFLTALASGVHGHFNDDRMYVHRLGNCLEAYLDWTPDRPNPEEPPKKTTTRHFSRAGILVRRGPEQHTVISTARGGVVKHFGNSGSGSRTCAGLLVEMSDGRMAASQSHDLDRDVNVVLNEDMLGDEASRVSLDVTGPLNWATFETVTPLKQSVLHVGMWTAGRWCRTLVRRLLQRRLITGKRPCPILFSRRIEFLDAVNPDSKACLRITDTVELTESRVRVARMAFGTDHQTAYVAASGVYQPGVLQPWTDLAEFVDQLNAERRVVVTRIW